MAWRVRLRLFPPKLPNARHLARHLARYLLAGLFLDPVPYGAHTTAPDALWMTVPVLTWSDPCFASRVCGSPLLSAALSDLVSETPEDPIGHTIHRACAGRGQMEIIRQGLISNRDRCTLFAVGKLSRALQDLYRQMRADYVGGNLPQPRLADLDASFEIGAAQAHELREIGALTDYVGFYRAQLARWHYHHPMDVDRRLRAAKKKPMRRARSPSRKRLDQRVCRRRKSQVGKSRRTASLLSQKPRSRSRRVHTADRSAIGKRPAIPRSSCAGASSLKPNTS